MFLYLARDWAFVGAHPDPDEFLQTEKIQGSQVKEMILGGQIQDAKTLIALLWYLNGLAYLS
jgi:hypothetical protein